MKLLPVLIFIAGGISGLIQASEIVEPIVLKDNQVVIQVKGVVCSFCAYGTEKNLSKLSFLDSSYFDGDGVLLDIHTHRITLALDKSKLVDFAAVNNAIVKGGYDPVTYYVRVHGQVEENNGTYELTSPHNNQVYHLQGQQLATLSQSQGVYVEGKITVDSIAELTVGQPVSLFVDSTKEGK